MRPCNGRRRVLACDGCRSAFPEEGKVGDLPFRIPQAFPGADGGGGNGVAPFRQFLIAANAVFGEKLHGGGRPFGRPPLVSRALPGLDVVLNGDEQADLPALLASAPSGK